MPSSALIDEYMEKCFNKIQIRLCQGRGVFNALKLMLCGRRVINHSRVI